METTQASLPFSPEGGKGERKYPRPPKLRRVVSISPAMPAPVFYKLLKEQGVTALFDTRLGRAYDTARFSHEGDFPYITQLHGIEYVYASQFAPTREMRELFDKTFKSVPSAAARDPEAWTTFLRRYEQLLIERKPLHDPAIKSVLYGQHEAVAVLCACPNHDDCHRSYATGIMANYIDGVELRVVYPPNKVPAHFSPRRYRLVDFPHAGLRVNTRGAKP